MLVGIGLVCGRFVCAGSKLDSLLGGCKDSNSFVVSHFKENLLHTKVFVYVHDRPELVIEIPRRAISLYYRHG